MKKDYHYQLMSNRRGTRQYTKTTFATVKIADGIKIGEDAARHVRNLVFKDGNGWSGLMAICDRSNGKCALESDPGLNQQINLP